MLKLYVWHVTIERNPYMIIVFAENKELASREVEKQLIEYKEYSEEIIQTVMGEIDQVEPFVSETQKCVVVDLWAY